MDQKLSEYFQPEQIQNAFRQYEEAKRDAFDESIIDIRMGADGISYSTFSNELELRCQIISNRVLKGTYQFYPFREVNIPKPSGGKRVLSIATIRDVLVQKLLYEVLYDEIEAKFQKTSKLDSVSWAYRKQKSAQSAATLIHSYIKQGFQFAFDADIIKFFDEIPHQELLILIESSFGKDTLTTNLLRRFIKTGGIPYPYQDKYDKFRNQNIFHCYKPNRKIIYRDKGIPQGGVLSGMLANLYLHSFDCWIVDSLSKKYELRYVRYADDFVILLKNSYEIPAVHNEVINQLNIIKLNLHDLDSHKSKYVDIIKDEMRFIGFSFDGNHIKIKEENINKFKERIKNKLRKSKDRKNEKNKIEQDYNFGAKAKKRLTLFVCRVINRKINGSGKGVCGVCGGLTGEKIRSWIGFFSAITDVTQLREIDKWIRKTLGEYFWERYGICLNRNDFRNAGLASLEQEYYRIRRKMPCKCKPIEQAEVYDNHEEQVRHTGLN